MIAGIEVEDPTAGRRIAARRTLVPGGARRLAGPIVLVAFWQLVTSERWVTARYLSSPSAVASATRQLMATGELQHDVAASLYRVEWGCAIGVAVGLGLAVVAGFFRVGEDLVDATMNILRAVPIVALLPLIIVWIGVGESAKIFLIAVGTAFPVYINTFGAIRGVDVKLVEAARAFGVGRWGLIRKVIVPGALPGFLVGVRWAIGTAWLLLVFAEQVNANSGIGYLIWKAQSFNQTDIIICGLCLYGLLGLGTDAAVRLLERRLLAWRRGFAGQ